MNEAARSIENLACFLENKTPQWVAFVLPNPKEFPVTTTRPVRTGRHIERRRSRAFHRLDGCVPPAPPAFVGPVLLNECLCAKGQEQRPPRRSAGSAQIRTGCQPVWANTLILLVAGVGFEPTTFRL
jgi:hypothetical protein